MRHLILLVVTLALFAPVVAHADPAFGEKLAKAAVDLTRQNVVYDGSYYRIPYPNGDVPPHVGVCADVIIRAYRKLGVDLQQRVHEDMQAHFGLYPHLWGMKGTDTNIDHRRVPNLRVFFARHGRSLPVSTNADYRQGDIVSWNLKKQGSLPHIGIVSNVMSADGKRPLMVHNIGEGQKLEDMLFDYTITGHYRYAGE
ncbi:MAG TPA: DUF1287 domain-containing protein [Patescibacteria group bacterium]|nr:DUF1287 domain-containing protein [Patescibacteria group bacterium]